MNSDPRLIAPNPANCKPIARESYAQHIVFQIRKMLSNELPSMPNIQSCVTCTKFNEAREWCSFYNGRPPARIIAYSCGTRAYEDKLDEDDEIPF